jgi:hypothetical protein
LHLKIWKAALSGLRIVEFYESHPRTSVGPEPEVGLARGSQIDLLRLVKTCRESGDIVEKIYRKVPVESFDLLRVNPGAAFFVNYDQDIILCNIHLDMAKKNDTMHE